MWQHYCVFALLFAFILLRFLFDFVAAKESLIKIEKSLSSRLLPSVNFVVVVVACVAAAGEADAKRIIRLRRWQTLRHSQRLQRQQRLRHGSRHAAQVRAQHCRHSTRGTIARSQMN